MSLLKFVKRFFFKKNKGISNGVIDENIPVVFIDRYETRVIPDIPSYIFEESELLISKLRKSEDDPFLSLRLIYDFLDVFSKFASTFTVCSKGCSSCCKIGVNVTALEAKYIENCTGHKVNINKKRKAKTNKSCPFLISDSCSIYEYRPFNCRTFFTADDPKYCKTPNEPHQVYGMNGGEKIPVVHQYRKYVDRLNKKNVGDIRTFF